MPSPKRRVKTRRDPLTPDEIRELLAGHPASCFPTMADFEVGQRRLVIEQETWDSIDWWTYGFGPGGSPIAGGPLGGKELEDGPARFGPSGPGAVFGDLHSLVRR